MPVPYCFHYCGFVTYFEIMKCAALFSFKIVLAIKGLLWFHVNFGIVFYFCRKYHWDFDRDCTESIDCFG